MNGSRLSTFFATLLFVAMLALTGCSDSMTGPDLDDNAEFEQPETQCCTTDPPDGHNTDPDDHSD